jgi:predicted acyltransferase
VPELAPYIKLYNFGQTNFIPKYYLMKTKKSEVKQSGRLQSLDVLRGFDMLWIVGGGSLVAALAKTTDWGWLHVIAGQLEHVRWEGFHFEDLIFPMFMFISGVAIPYAVTSKVEQGVNRKLLFNKILKRGIILVILGIIYNGNLRREFDGLSDMRIASVLGQIGLGYLFAATIVLYTKSFKTRVAWLIGIMSGIAILQLAIPVPGHGAGLLLDNQWCMNAYIDRMLMPGRLHGQVYDPEGLLCIVSAITVTLMGALAGAVLRDGEPASKRKATTLALGGAALVVAALVLSPFYPIIKACWTVPFNMLAAGISSILLSLFYFSIDVKGWTKGMLSYVILFFTVIGMNSITIYLGHSIIDFDHASQFFLGCLASPLGEWIVILGSIVIEWLVLYYLYQKKIFLRV